MNAHYQRATLLVNQERYEEALRELAQAAEEEANNPYHHGLRAVALSRLDRHQQALEASAKAIEIAPDLDYGHYVRAVICLDRGLHSEARDSIQTAIRIDPNAADYFGLLSKIESGRERWHPALEAAEAGLRLDPTNEFCRLGRSQALLKLGRRDEADSELDQLMTENPNDACTHDAKGWLCLEQGDAAAAKTHFLEALRLEPNFVSARAGLANALKARHFLFGWLLQLLLYFDRFRTWGIYLVAAGVVLAMRFGDQWSKTHPDFYLWIWWVKTVFWIVAVALILAQPLFDLVLRLDREGRVALTAEQTRASNWNGLCLAAALLVMSLWAWKGGSILPFMGFALVSLTTAIGRTVLASDDWVRRRMRRVTVLAALHIPAAYLMPIVFVVVAVKARVVLPLLVKGAFYLLAISIFISSFADNILEYFEKRRPDKAG